MHSLGKPLVVQWIRYESNTSKFRRSNPVHKLFFYFPTRKYFTILFRFLDFLRSLDRLKVLIRVFISEFYMTWRKNSLKYLPIGGGTFVPPCRDGVDIAYVQTG